MNMDTFRAVNAIGKLKVVEERELPADCIMFIGEKDYVKLNKLGKKFSKKELESVLGNKRHVTVVVEVQGETK